MTAVLTEASITCPECGLVSVEEMPWNACVHLYKCRGCGATLTPARRLLRFLLLLRFPLPAKAGGAQDSRPLLSSGLAG